MNKILICCAAFLLKSAIGAAAFNDRCYEGINPDWKDYNVVQKRLEIVAKVVPEDATVFEVGANNGSESIQFAKKWPKGAIISFEPIFNQFLKYRERAQYYPNMYGYNLAVNTYNGYATFYLNWGSGGDDSVFEGASSLLEADGPWVNDYKGPKVVVPCVVFDDWCAAQNIENIDFMWLDIEGFELQFLQSSPRIMRTVKAIHTETNFANFRKDVTLFKVLKPYLEFLGFEMVAHWYNEGLQGDAIFVRTDLLDKLE